MHRNIYGEVFLGLQKALTQTLQGQLGLAVGFTSNASLSGVIWDDADPQFNNYTYRYKIQHTHVAVKGKLLSDAGYWLIPWISGSLGVGFNDTHGFHNTPTLFEALPNPGKKQLGTRCGTNFKQWAWFKPPLYQWGFIQPHLSCIRTWT